MMKIRIGKLEKSKNEKNKLYSRIILNSKEMKFLLKDIETEINELTNY